VPAVITKSLFWGSLAGIAWTHAGYPAAAALAARLAGRPVRRADITPGVTLIIPAHDEEDVIAGRLENLRELDYPPERLAIVVASDASNDRTDAIVEEIAARDPRVSLLRCPRGGKLAAINRAVRATEGEVVAFSDANTRWAPDALRLLVRNLADPAVGYVCGQLRLEDAAGTNREGLYWRYELWLRASESALGSITGGNGAIYAVRRSDWVEHAYGQDLGLPDAMVKRGKRAVYEPAALAFEKPSRDVEDEYRRKVRMLKWSWRHMLEGGMLRGVTPVYLGELVSHRVLRYGSGMLHVALLASNVALLREGGVYRSALAGQLAFAGLAEAGRRRAPLPGASVAWYYVLVTSSTVVSLADYLRSGVPPVWDRAEGTR
jgi:cellulose synthase/poly-beta-1,6-N-acetylglucosamine synthase-like glycosyltransferase